ncbi:MAG: hypothetical protein O7B26_04625, partial [Planctomycetota bacterium]|nr:hypothetical protein [Planctomycetota bacterium]
ARDDKVRVQDRIRAKAKKAKRVNRRAKARAKIPEVAKAEMQKMVRALQENPAQGNRIPVAPRDPGRPSPAGTDQPKPAKMVRMDRRKATPDILLAGSVPEKAEPRRTTPQTSVGKRAKTPKKKNPMTAVSPVKATPTASKDKNAIRHARRSTNSNDV